MNTFLKYYNSPVSIITLAFLGAISGLIFKENTYFLKPIGDLFINLIKMLLVPVIIFTVINATSKLNDHANALQLGVFGFIYFFITSFFAGCLGVFLAYYLSPGIGITSLPTEFLTLPANLSNINPNVKIGFWDFIFGMIPNNPFKAITEGNLLPILFFAIFLGIGVSYSKNKDKVVVINIVSATSDILMWMVKKVMLLAPIAVFSLMAYLLASIGIEIIYVVGKLFLVVIGGLFIWLYLVLAGSVGLFSKISYWSFVKHIIPLKIVAFSTSSSLVSLPKNIETCDKIGINHNISSFILPIGATLNMNGSSMFYSIVTVFFAQMFGVNLDMYTYFLIAITATLGSMATPGIPGLSLTVVMVMLVANVPLIGLPLIIAIDRILDMFITTVNVIGDTSCAVIADKVFAKKIK